MWVKVALDLLLLSAARALHILSAFTFAGIPYKWMWLLFKAMAYMTFGQCSRRR